MVNEKYTSEQIIAAIKAVDGLVYLAARKLGCGPKTIYNRAKKTQAIQQAIEDSRGELVDIAEQKMRAAVMDREPWAVALVLKTLGKNRGYVERQEHTGAWGGPIAHRVTMDLATLSEQELDELERHERESERQGGGAIRPSQNLQPDTDTG